MHAEETPFQLYTVAETLDPVRCSGGLRVVPDYTPATAPAPHVIVIPAQRGWRSEAARAWLRSAKTQLTMSVCTGAFVLAGAGMLDGLAATTHHEFFDRFEATFPAVKLDRKARFVFGSERIATAAGLSSGIDLALQVVARFFGLEVAQQTAVYMEYRGTDWRP